MRNKIIADLESRPKIGAVAYADDGGVCAYLVLADETGATNPNVECVMPVGDGLHRLYRFPIPRRALANGVLEVATSEVPQRGEPWAAAGLDGTALLSGIAADELIKALCSENILNRARAYRSVGEYFGFDKLDPHPLTITREEAERVKSGGRRDIGC